ncbi:hypothetical protein LTR42_009057 [Elasticomyces elasticus]|nr:hypothetical protein LTR42_009057 [Elasticomyces elasticus]
MRTLTSLTYAAVVVALVEGARDLAWVNDNDLTKFVTVSHPRIEMDERGGADCGLTNVQRPEIKVPLFNITHKADNGITPGMWFVGPYGDIRQKLQPPKYHQPCSTGPAIYDGSGQLIWTGACSMRNQNACDLRVFHNEAGEEQLSVLMAGYESGLDGVAAIMDNSFRLTKSFTAPAEEIEINMHEWVVVEGGRSALYLTHVTRKLDISELELENRTTGWVAIPGFREIELATGKTLFEWFSQGHVSLSETTALPPDEAGLAGAHPGWSWFHPNSVDKDPENNYLLSGRFMDTIYKIGPDGQIVWRLGGKRSSFTLDGFNFSKQHDARFMSKEGPIETISFFDNARAAHPGLNVSATSSTSSALIVALNTESMTATVVQRISRPDKRRTDLRGNYQTLPNGNSFVSWADNSYISEHGPDGKLLLEAQWQSTRFVTYRAYKFNFTAIPMESPVLKAFVYGATPDTSTTAWNGATEVKEWRFYGERNVTTSVESPLLIGISPRDGFETEFASDGYQRLVYAEAVAKNGTVLGKTKAERVSLPRSWASFQTSIESPDNISMMPRVVDTVSVKDEL